MKDLIFLVADGYQEKILEGFLPRVPNSSNLRPFTFDITRHPGHDSGCVNDSHEFLRPFINQYNYAIVLLDYEGCGLEMNQSREEIEGVIENDLARNGWVNRNLAVVIDPEVENWIWINSPHVTQSINWNENNSLFDWCRDQGYLEQNSFKPTRPKESFEKVLRKAGTSKSSSIYKNISSRVSYRSCQDPAFNKLINQLKIWFVL